MSCHFVAAGTFRSDFGAQENKVCPDFYLKASGVGSPPSGHCTRLGKKQNSVPRHLAQSGSRCWPLSVLLFGASVADHWRHLEHLWWLWELTPRTISFCLMRMLTGANIHCLSATRLSSHVLWPKPHLWWVHFFPRQFSLTQDSKAT